MLQVGSEYRDLLDKAHIRIKEIINSEHIVVVVNNMFLEKVDNEYLEKYCEEINRSE